MSDVGLPELVLSFEGGTLLLDGPEPELRRHEGEHWVWDDRVGGLRCPGRCYREVFAQLFREARAGRCSLVDNAREYGELAIELAVQREPFPHQEEALEAWQAGGRRGVVVLPTGAGKTYVAEMAIASCSRSTLVVAPTIDLMNQWYDGLSLQFDGPIGLMGGGYYEIENLTVTTYDSAFLHMERLGNRFGLIVFDECHHLPSASYAQAAEMAVAPWRLGLTATPERNDDRHHKLDDLIGPIVYRKRIRELAGDYLASYHTVQISVPMNEDDAAAYQDARAVYRGFVQRQGIRMSSKNGWSEFIMRSARSSDGRRAFKAYRRQKAIALAHQGKLAKLETLLRLHARDRVIVFTNDNDTVYQICRRYLLPAITHKTPTKERKAILERFNGGQYPCLVTSKVLNEGVNVPAANVAIVLSGSGSVREHVQRLGRILRKQKDKRATLYELITRDSVEEYVSTRRRAHDAYR